MKRLLFVLLLLSNFTYAQPRLEGRVYLYQEKGNNRALPDVSIRAAGSGSAVTKADGYYAFTFDNSVDVTALTVMKIGYEIINQEDLRHVELGKKQQQNVYFDIEGNTEKRKRELLDAALRQFRKRRDEYYRVLDMGGAEAEKLKKKLEKEAGKTFASLDEVRSYVYDQFGADEKTLGDVVASVIRLNLDHTNQDVEKIKQYTLNGDLQSALNLLNIEQALVKIRRNNALIKTILQDNLAEKEKFLAGVPILLSNGLYSKVDSVYQLAMEADTADLELKFTYASFLQDQNQFAKAINLYKSYIKSLAGERKDRRARALNSLGILLNGINQEREARKHYEEALEIYRNLASKNPDTYEIAVAMTLNNLGWLLNQVRERQEAKKLLQEALGIYRKHAEKNPDDAYKLGVAMTLTNLGSLLTQIRETQEARKLQEEALEIYRRLATKNPDAYEYGLAGALANLAILLHSINQRQEARILHEEALEIYTRLATKNPDAYEPDMLTTLNNLGVLLNTVGERPKARKYYEEALEIHRRLATKNPEGYKVGLSSVLTNLGVLLNDMNEKQEARKYYEEALKIRRSLATQSPDAYERLVAKTLNDLGNLFYDDYNQKGEARKYYEESLEIYRRLAEKNPEAYEPDVAKTLSNLGGLVNTITQKREAKQHYEEALEIYRRLVVKTPRAYRFELVKAAYSTGQISVELESFKNALTTYKEALHHANLLRSEENWDIHWAETVITKLIQTYQLTANRDSVICYSKEYYNLILSVPEPDRNVRWDSKAISVSGDIALNYNAQCIADSAAAYYAKTLDHNKALLERMENTSSNDLGKIGVHYNGNAAWYALHTRQAKTAEEYARQAIEIDPSALWVNTNLAHALLLQRRYGEAEELYRSLKKSPYEQDTSKTYADILLHDLQQLACSGAIPAEHQPEVERVKAFLRK
jgi:tetratricopeptide (TPR) repeat protein